MAQYEIRPLETNCPTFVTTDAERGAGITRAAGIVAAYLLNELDPDGRTRLVQRLTAAGRARRITLNSPKAGARALLSLRM